MEVADKIINRLSSKLDYNSRTQIQADLTTLFNHPEYWNTRAIQGLSVKRFEGFKEFACYRTPWGLGWTDKVLEAFILPELTDIWMAIEEDIRPVNPNGVKSKHTNDAITCNSTNQGNSREYRIALLKRDAPEIAEQVIKGEISAAEGMRKAGKRKPMVTIPVSVDGFYNAIQKRLKQDEIMELKQML